jgi:hypothetical protein
LKRYGRNSGIELPPSLLAELEADAAAEAADATDGEHEAVSGDESAGGEA